MRATRALAFVAALAWSPSASAQFAPQEWDASQLSGVGHTLSFCDASGNYSSRNGVIAFNATGGGIADVITFDGNSEPRISFPTTNVGGIFDMQSGQLCVVTAALGGTCQMGFDGLSGNNYSIGGLACPPIKTTGQTFPYFYMPAWGGSAVTGIPPIVDNGGTYGETPVYWDVSVSPPVLHMYDYTASAWRALAAVGGTVTSVTGTAGQILCTPSSPNPVCSLVSTGAGAGSCTNCSVTFDAQGRETAYSSGTAPVTSVTATPPVFSSGGATPVISEQGAIVSGSTSTTAQSLGSISTAPLGCVTSGGTCTVDGLTLSGGLHFNAGTGTETLDSFTCGANTFVSSSSTSGLACTHVGLTETSGPTDMAMGGVPDGEALYRNGSTIVGDAPTVASWFWWESFSLGAGPATQWLVPQGITTTTAEFPVAIGIGGSASHLTHGFLLEINVTSNTFAGAGSAWTIIATKNGSQQGTGVTFAVSGTTGQFHNLVSCPSISCPSAPVAGDNMGVQITFAGTVTSVAVTMGVTLRVF